MNRILFTVGADVYELTPRLQNYFIDRTTTDNTIDVWFEGETLHHEFIDSDGGSTTIATESVNVVEVFQTLPTDAREELRQAGATPLIDASNGLYATDDAGTINPREFA
jgi:hypothetical protein